jgi:hypothetical protein
LDIRPRSRFDPSFLDSNVYGWCTPSLENLNIDLSSPKAVTMRMLGQRRFFVNITRLRRLRVSFWDELNVLNTVVMKDFPQSLVELKIVSGFDEDLAVPSVVLPPVCQMVLEKLRLQVYEPDGFVTVIVNLNLRYRYVRVSFNFLKS